MVSPLPLIQTVVSVWLQVDPVVSVWPLIYLVVSVRLWFIQCICVAPDLCGDDLHGPWPLVWLLVYLIVSVWPRIIW